jgi:hypothetical protein
MSWVTVIWSMTAGICLALAGVHLLVWSRSKKSWANLLFAVAATSAAACASAELFLMTSETPGEYGERLRLFHVPLAFLVISMVWFIRLYLQAGPLWLAWLITGMRVVILALQFILEPNLNFLAITDLHHIAAWGETVASPIGEKNPWTNLTHASGILFLLFVLDATRTAWHKGYRRRAVVVGGTFACGIAAAVVSSELMNQGVLPVPCTLSILFLIIVCGMAYEMSVDLLRANQLAAELADAQERMRLSAEAANLGLWEWDIAHDEIWFKGSCRCMPTSSAKSSASRQGWWHTMSASPSRNSGWDTSTTSSAWSRTNATNWMRPPRGFGESRPGVTSSSAAPIWMR